MTPNSELRLDVLGQVLEHGPTATWAIALAVDEPLPLVARVLSILWRQELIERQVDREASSGLRVYRWRGRVRA
jgi:predicted methyltransferase